MERFFSQNLPPSVLEEQRAVNAYCRKENRLVYFFIFFKGVCILYICRGDDERWKRSASLLSFFFLSYRANHTTISGQHTCTWTTPYFCFLCSCISQPPDRFLLPFNTLTKHKFTIFNNNIRIFFFTFPYFHIYKLLFYQYIKCK